MYLKSLNYCYNNRKPKAVIHIPLRKMEHPGGTRTHDLSLSGGLLSCQLSYSAFLFFLTVMDVYVHAIIQRRKLHATLNSKHTQGYLTNSQLRWSVNRTLYLSKLHWMEMILKDCNLIYIK